MESIEKETIVATFDSADVAPSPNENENSDVIKVEMGERDSAREDELVDVDG